MFAILIIFMNLKTTRLLFVTFRIRSLFKWMRIRQNSRKTIKTNRRKKRCRESVSSDESFVIVYSQLFHFHLIQINVQGWREASGFLIKTSQLVYSLGVWKKSFVCMLTLKWIQWSKGFGPQSRDYSAQSHNEIFSIFCKQSLIKILLCFKAKGACLCILCLTQKCVVIGFRSLLLPVFNCQTETLLFTLWNCSQKLNNVTQLLFT